MTALQSQKDIAMQSSDYYLPLKCGYFNFKPKSTGIWQIHIIYVYSGCNYDNLSSKWIKKNTINFTIKAFNLWNSATIYL